MNQAHIDGLNKSYNPIKSNPIILIIKYYDLIKQLSK